MLELLANFRIKMSKNRRATSFVQKLEEALTCTLAATNQMYFEILKFILRDEQFPDCALVLNKRENQVLTNNNSCPSQDEEYYSRGRGSRGLYAKEMKPRTRTFSFQISGRALLLKDYNILTGVLTAVTVQSVIGHVW